MILTVWSYCAADWVMATTAAGGVKPLVCPSKQAEIMTPHLVEASKADLVYLNLHGFDDQPHYYGQLNKKIGPTALTAEMVAARDWSNVVVFAEVCFSAARGGGPVARAFLENGAKAFIGSTDTAYGRTRSTLWDGEADKLMRYFRHFYGVKQNPQWALMKAKQLLKLTSIPLDEDDKATLMSFVCLLPDKDKKQ